MRMSVTLLSGLLLCLPAAVTAADAGGKVERQVIYAQALTNVPGKTLTAVALDAGPGAKSAARHHHAGTVFVYVVSGSVRVHFAGHDPQVFHAGECFVEKPGTEHLSTENLSATRHAKLLAVFVADNGAELTTYEH